MKPYIVKKETLKRVCKNEKSFFTCPFLLSVPCGTSDKIYSSSRDCTHDEGEFHFACVSHVQRHEEKRDEE